MSQEQRGTPTTHTACDELRDLLPAYSVGATTPEETARVQTLLPLCPDVAEDMADYIALADEIALSVEPMQPAAHVHDKLMAAVKAEKKQAAPVKPSHDGATGGSTIAFADQPKAQQAQARPRWAAWMVAAAASILLIASNGFWIYQINETNQQLEQIEAAFSAINQQRTELINLVGDGNVQTVALNSTTDNSRTATVIWNQETNDGLLYTDTLPELSPEQTYQLWFIGEGSPISGGLFRPGVDQDSFYSFQPPQSLSDYNAIAISVEPASGSEAPTTDPLAVGET